MPYAELMVRPTRQDLDATDRARQHIRGYPPSSPSVALFKDGELVYFMKRQGTCT